MKIISKDPWYFPPSNGGEESGLSLYDKVIVKKPMGTAPSRLKLWNNRKTVRIHEELLVFKKKT